MAAITADTDSTVTPVDITLQEAQDLLGRTHFLNLCASVLSEKEGQTVLVTNPDGIDILTAFIS